MCSAAPTYVCTYVSAAILKHAMLLTYVLLEGSVFFINVEDAAYKYKHSSKYIMYIPGLHIGFGAN